jgi:hypothetical protein
MTRLLPLTFALILSAVKAQTIAFVDLSKPLNVATPQHYGPARGRNHGGGCYDCPHPGANVGVTTLAAKLMWAVESTDPAPARAAVEILITNTSKEPILIPVGIDATSLLKPPARGRQGISFGVCVSPCATNDSVGFSEAATNADHPETSMELRPGESIGFKLPFNRRRAADKIEAQGTTEGELSATVGLFTMETDQDGELSSGLPVSVKVENSLKWTSPTK